MCSNIILAEVRDMERINGIIKDLIILGEKLTEGRLKLLQLIKIILGGSRPPKAIKIMNEYQVKQLKQQVIQTITGEPTQIKLIERVPGEAIKTTTGEPTQIKLIKNLLSGSTQKEIQIKLIQTITGEPTQIKLIERVPGEVTQIKLIKKLLSGPTQKEIQIKLIKTTQEEPTPIKLAENSYELIDGDIIKDEIMNDMSLNSLLSNER
eukprot:332091_1